MLLKGKCFCTRMSIVYSVGNNAHVLVVVVAAATAAAVVVVVVVFIFVVVVVIVLVVVVVVVVAARCISSCENKALNESKIFCNHGICATAVFIEEGQSLRVQMLHACPIEDDYSRGSS